MLHWIARFIGCSRRESLTASDNFEMIMYVVMYDLTIAYVKDLKNQQYVLQYILFAYQVQVATCPMCFLLMNCFLYVSALYHLTHFMPLISFDTPWKQAREILWFSDVFRGYQKRSVAWNGLTMHKLWSENAWQDQIHFNSTCQSILKSFRLHWKFVKKQKKTFLHPKLKTRKGMASPFNL